MGTLELWYMKQGGSTHVYGDVGHRLDVVGEVDTTAVARLVVVAREANRACEQGVRVCAAESKWAADKTKGRSADREKLGRLLPALCNADVRTYLGRLLIEYHGSSRIDLDGLRGGQ